MTWCRQGQARKFLYGCRPCISMRRTGHHIENQEFCSWSLISNNLISCHKVLNGHCTDSLSNYDNSDDDDEYNNEHHYVIPSLSFNPFIIAFIIVIISLTYKFECVDLIKHRLVYHRVDLCTGNQQACHLTSGGKLLEQRPGFKGAPACPKAKTSPSSTAKISTSWTPWGRV